MAWLQRIKHKDGTKAYWIQDRRDGRSISIPLDAKSEAVAKMLFEQYECRRALEKEGYDDQYAGDLGREVSNGLHIEME